MACNNFHEVRTPGAGLCCAAVTSGALPKTLGASVQVTDSKGHCGHCMVVPSKSTKHPGIPVLKFVRGNPNPAHWPGVTLTNPCPTASYGCCALQSQ